jgi:MYXO-CTERM domain-containing protein
MRPLQPGILSRGRREPRFGRVGAAGVLAALAFTAPGRAAAGECDAPKPGWIACEDFESGHLGWQAWLDGSPFVQCVGCTNEGNDPARIRLTNEPGAAYAGEWALHMPGEASAQYQGGSLAVRTCAGEKKAGCELTNYEHLYFRTFVKLAEDHQYVHHFLALAGSRPDAFWDTDGNAGCRPNGERWAGTTVDFNKSHELFFYTYHPDMGCDAGGYCSGDYAQNICSGCADKGMPCENGLECCWGNHFEPEPAVVLPRGQWVCLEMFMKLNTPGAADGEMAFWIDDQLGVAVDGMRWRDVPELGLNKAFLQHYIEVGDTDVSNRVWFDNVVVSTERIGCGDARPEPDPTDTDGDSDGTTTAGPDLPTTSGGDDPGSSSAPGPVTSGGDSPGSSGSDGGPGGGATGASDTAGSDAGESSGGCGCRADDAQAGRTALGLALAGLSLRRRRRR